MASHAHHGAAPARRKIPPRLMAVAVALVVLIALAVFFLVTGGNGDQRTIDRRSSADQGPPATLRSSTGSLEASGTALLPIPKGALKTVVGDDVRGRSVTVQTTSPQQGFWVGTSDVQHLYVDYDGTVPEAGARVDLEGTVRAVPGDPEQSLAITGDDLQEVRAQGGYIQASSVEPVGDSVRDVPKGD